VHVKELSVFHTDLGFNMVSGFVLESMHLLGGGVFGNIMDMVTSYERKMDFHPYITLASFNLLCNRMDDIAAHFWISDPARALRYVCYRTG